MTDAAHQQTPARGAVVGDIGGTNARLAFVEFADGGPIVSRFREYASPSYKSGSDIFREYLKEAGFQSPPTIAVIAVAGPVSNGAVHFTNLGWGLSEANLHDLGFSAAHLLNDFEALALSTPHLTAPDLRRVGPSVPGDPAATVAIIGPGTGFGASALVRSNGRAVAVAAEGGHASFAPNDDLERQILQVMAKQYSHVSIERIVSGPGLCNLHTALNEIEGVKADADSPTDITQRALKNEAPYARTILRFCAILGSVAGDFALIYGARGGVFIAGGIAPLILPLLDRSDFRKRFEAKGRFVNYLTPIPTHVVLHPRAAFLGAADVARQMGA